MPDIESLDIKVSTTTEKAVQSLEKLKKKLSETGAASVKATKAAEEGFKGTATEIGKLASALNSAGLSHAAKELKDVQKAVNQTKLKDFSKQANELADAFDKLGDKKTAEALRGMSDPFKTEAKAENQKRYAAAIQSVSNSFKGMVSPLTNAIKGVQNFIKAIGRIALYRAIRTAIKNISAAVKEGLTNLKAYSTEVGTEFAPAVENLQKHVLLLKNSFATALRPVIEALIPSIIQLVDWFSKLADFAAQVFSVLTGKVDDNGRYTKAVLSDLEQSNKKAKELRRTLLGFDEINRLDGDTGSGEKSSAGLMFTQADVSDKAVTTAEKIKEIFGKIKDFVKSIDWATVGKIVAAIAGLVAGAKIAGAIGKIVGFIKSIWTILQKIWPIIKAIIGGITPVAGIIIAIVAACALWGDKIAEFFDNMKLKGSKILDWFEEKLKFSSALTAINDLQRTILDLFTGVFGTVASMIYKLFHLDFKGALKDLVHLINVVLKGIIGLVVGLANVIIGVADDIYYYIRLVAKFIWNNAIVPVVNWIATAIAKIHVFLHNGIIDFKIGFQKVAKWLLEKLNEWVLEPIQNAINSAIVTWNKLFGTNIEPVKLTVDTTSFDAKIEELENTKLDDITETVKFAAEWTEDVTRLNWHIDATPLYNELDKAERAVNSYIDRIGKNLVSMYDAVGNMKPGAARNGVAVQRYASGGFPSAGSMFIAGESGPEFVGNINGQTGVWNSDQLVNAMFTAFSSALAANPSGGGDIYLDGEVIYKNTVRRNNNQVRSTGRSALLT